MGKKIKNVGIILKPKLNADIISQLSNLVRWLSRRDLKIFITKETQNLIQKNQTAKTIKNLECAEDLFIYNKTDLIISLGGDGTLIGISRYISPKIPIFSINLGHLGFITEFSKNDFYDELSNVLNSKFSVIKKSLYRIKLSTQKNKKFYFFNDIVFSKNNIARMFTLSLDVNEEHVYDLSGDGLIVSTTVGSTAYSMAAGGPIVHPEVKGIILSPICPHSLTHRPMVIPDSSFIKIELLERAEDVTITLDGQVAINLHPNDHVYIDKTKNKYISLIKNPNKTYFHTLKEKFVHGRRQV